MRQPTSTDDQLAWWRKALKEGLRPDHDWPECGYYKLRSRVPNNNPRIKRQWSTIYWPVQILLIQPIDWTTGQLIADESHLFLVGKRKVSNQLEQLDLWWRLRPVTLTEFQWLTVQTDIRQTPLLTF